MQQVQQLASAAAAPSFAATAQVRPVGARWQVLVSLDSAADSIERRTFEADDCESLAQAFALIVAVHIDALAVVDPPILPRPQPSVPTPTTTSDAASSPATRRGPSARLRASSAPMAPSAVAPRSTTPAVQGLIRVEGGASAGIWSGFGGGAGLMAGALGPRWRVEGGVMGWPARSASDRSGQVAVRLDLVAARVRGCGGPATAQVSVPLCIGAEVGGLRGVGTTGVDQPDVRWTPWGAATFGAGLAWAPRPWIAPYLGLEGSIPVVRPRFSVGDVVVTRTGAVGARLWAGIELRFGSRRRPPP